MKRNEQRNEHRNITAERVAAHARACKENGTVQAPRCAYCSRYVFELGRSDAEQICEDPLRHAHGLRCVPST
jgi:hypothetical protein